MRSMAKVSLLSIAQQVINILFSLITSVYLSRVLHPDGIGLVAYAQNTASYFILLASFGMGTYGVRCISTQWDDPDRINIVFSELFVLNALFTTVALGLYLLLIFCFSDFSRLPLYLSCGVLIAANYVNVDWLLSGQEDYVFILLRNTAVKVLSIVALVLFVRRETDLIPYALIFSLAMGVNNVLSGLVSLAEVRRRMRLTLHHLNLRQHLKPIGVIFLSMLLNNLYAKLDITMIGRMASVESVGYYSYAQKLILPAVNFCTAIASAFLPRMSYYYETDREKFNDLIEKGTQALALVCFPMAAGFCLLAPTAVSLLYGKPFAPSADAIRCLSPMILIIPMSGLLCFQLLIASRRERMFVPIYSTATAANVCMNLLLIPGFAHIGASIASTVSEAVICIFGVIYAAKKVGIRLEWRALLRGLLTSLVMTAVIFPLYRVLRTPLPALLLPTVAGAAIYFGLNYLLKTPMLMEGVKRVHGLLIK